MSILSALHQQHGSIDDLAKLPQAMIMQMAQRKEIAPEMVAPILSRKAELMDSIARTKAMQGAGVPQPSVMEQVMQKNATSEHPQQMPQEAHQAGIAQLPVEEPQYAGGGIVAFADGGTPEEQRKKALEALNVNMPDLPADYRGTLSDYLSNPEWAQAYEKNQQDRETARRAILDNNPIPTVNRDILNPSPSIRAQVPVTPIIAPVSTPTTPTTPSSKVETKPTGIKSLTKPTTPVVQPPTGPQQPSELQTLLAQNRSDIESGKATSDKAREDAKWSRLLEAGLGIMGGESSNFAQNVGRGATQAARGYAEDIKGIRAEELDRQKQLSALGLKGYELNQGAKKQAAEEAYMKAHGKYFEQVGAAAGQRGALGAGNADKIDIAALKVGLDNAQKALLTAKKADKPAIQQQIDAYVNRINSLAGVGGASTPLTSGAFNYVPGKGLIPVQ